MKKEWITASLCLALACPLYAAPNNSPAVKKQAAAEKPVYLFELIEKQPYANLWRNTVWNKVPNKKDFNFSWLKSGGTTSPAETVKIGNETYYKIEACRPHLCGGDYDILVLINKKKVMALQLYALPKGNVSNGRKMEKMYGTPTALERRYFNVWKQDYGR
ncbi:Ivy family c-type lysozyme inhibitor [Neisseria montereyensis]|uniref:Ivy family c-type lysozyme inhibitor n=1 Tax=Neisseria montereyensis TaxID=2973938 RepID=A0ABT2FE73_9NEIS|nr:Ivy family c-type lysozyme inhibitor [Neisseria montereyensis]MCS4534514.1 Ivy family c-type lysozyme inhibitor [Neisseria montereyensis]